MTVNALPEAALTALRAGNKIAAIRELREQEALDLAAAKARVEQFIANDPQLANVFAQQAAASSRGCLLAVTVILLLALLGAAWYWRG